MKQISRTFRAVAILAMAALLTGSCGNHSGKMHVRQDPEGRFTVLSMDAVGDGSQYRPTAKAIFGDKFEDFQRAHSDEKEREIIRGNVISEYVRTHGLNVHFYQDYGWPAVRIPTPDNR